MRKRDRRRWACRIRWRIKSVRVERLQDMGEAGAVAAGFKSKDLHAGLSVTALHAASMQWDRDYGIYSWDANPWVRVLVIEGA